MVTSPGNAPAHAREARLGDLDALCALGRDTFCETFAEANSREDMERYLTEAFAPSRIHAELVDPSSTWWVVEADGVLLGYAKLNVGSAQTEEMPSSWAELQRIYIRSSAHGLGLGSTLLAMAEEEARQLGADTLWLGVWEHNERALGFYRARGFEQHSTHTFVLGDDKQTDLVMVKSLR